MTDGPCGLLPQVSDLSATVLSDDVSIGVLADGQGVACLLRHFTGPASGRQQRKTNSVAAGIRPRATRAARSALDARWAPYRLDGLGVT